MIKVSVVIPVYNVEKYLEQALNSCLNQTLKDIEIIIVNDGSTDSSGTIALRYSKEYSNIIYIETDNQGLSMARNNGMKVARGEYIYFLDSDDWIEPECLEKCCIELDNYNLDCVTFDYVHVFENQNGVQYKQLELKQNLDRKYIYNGLQLAEKYIKKGGMSAAVWKNVYRKSFLEKNNLSFVEGLYYEDNPFQLMVLNCANRVKYIPFMLYNYRVRHNSIMTSTMSINKIKSSFYIANFFIDFYENKNCDKEIWKSYIGICLLGIWKCNFAGISATDLKNIEPLKNYILDEKDKLISRIQKIYDVEEKSIDDIRNMCKLIEIIVLTLNYRSELQEKILTEVLKKSKEFVTNILNTFPLNDEHKIIGIYGSGVNADYILDLYEKYVGKIKADIIFIDSRMPSYTHKYNGKDIINVKDIAQIDIEEIIILSFLYEQEMYDTLKSLYGDRYQIYRLYMDSMVSVEGSQGELYLLDRKLRKNTKRIILTATPEHYNIGDHLITKGQYVFFQKYLPEYEIIEITQRQYLKYRGIICASHNPDDVILICGGGFLGSLWENELTVVEYILRDFCENKLIILPQSIFYEDSEYGNYRKKIDTLLFGMQKDITICFRENKSMETFNMLGLKNVKTKYLPDMALAVDNYSSRNNRKNIIFCFRDDKERIVDEYDIEELKAFFIRQGVRVHEESMLNVKAISIRERMHIIDNKLDKFQQSALVITDRLHCMISCAITGTPCIALDNLTGKVSGVYEWIKDLEYIKVVQNCQEIIECDLLNWCEIGKNHTYSKKFSNEFNELCQIIKSGE